MLVDEIRQALNPDRCSKEAYEAFLQRLTEGRITTQENPLDHFTVYFQPYNKVNKQVFLTHHKKSGLWISPGGHIDQGEDLLTTLNKEIGEELGLPPLFEKFPQPFLFTVTRINNPPQTCRVHYDIWTLLETDGTGFQTDTREFYTTKWLAIDEAKQIVTDPANREALSVIEKLN